jgi:hypothetical protein
MCRKSDMSTHLLLFQSARIIKIQLSSLVYYKANKIVIFLKCIQLSILVYYKANKIVVFLKCIQLIILVYYKANKIIFFLKCNLLSLWSRWKIRRVWRYQRGNHSLTNYKWLEADQWLSPFTLVSSTNKADWNIVDSCVKQHNPNLTWTHNDILLLFYLNKQHLNLWYYDNLVKAMLVRW